MKSVAVIAAAALAVAGPAAAQLADDGFIRMSQAVGVAERQVAGRAIEADMETRGGRVVYEIDLIRGSTLHRAQVDARSGRLVGIEKPRIENWVRSWVDAARLRQGAKAVPLAERLALLEQRTGGEVKDVAFAVRKGRGAYDIEIATAAGVGKVRIDSATGKRISLAEGN